MCSIVVIVFCVAMNDAVHCKEIAGRLYRRTEGSAGYALVRGSPGLTPSHRQMKGPELDLSNLYEWTCIGPWGGSVGGVAVSSNFGTDSTVFAGTAGGAYRSVDCANTWVRSNDGLEEAGFVALTCAGGTDGTVVWFANVWEHNLFRSDDEGHTWYVCSSSLPDTRISALAPSPNYSKDSTLFMATGQWCYPGSVYRSRDGGRTWVHIGDLLNGKCITHLTLSPGFAQDSMIFVGTEHDGIYRSLNGGESWDQVNTGLVRLSIYRIAISPGFAADSTVFLTECDADEAVYRSLDGGTTWHKVLNAFASVVVISPDFSEDREVFVGSFDQGVYKSTNGGDTWINLGGPYFNTGRIAISPEYATDSTVFTAHINSGGLFYSSDRGAHWKKRCEGLSALATRSIGVSPRFEKSPVVFASPSMSAGPFRTTDGGVTWYETASGLFNRQGDSFSPSPRMNIDSTLFFSVWYDGVYYSRDLGDSWIRCVNGFPPVGYRYVPEVSCSPSYPEDSVVFACLCDSSARRSRDGGASWQLCGAGSFTRDNQDICFSPNFRNDGTVFMTQVPSGVVMSTDGGSSWWKRDNGLYGFLREIAISPDFVNDSTLLALERNRNVFKTTNGGVSWSKIWEYPARYLYYAQFSPYFASDRTVYLAGEKGIYISTNRGESWDPWNDGFDIPQETVELACSYGEDSTYYLFAGTCGSGVWVRKLNVGVEERSSKVQDARYRLQISPNPFIRTTVVSYESPAIGKDTQPVTVSIYDMSGRLVEKTRGSVVGRNLPVGVYFVKAMESRPAKMVKLW